ncbi:unnamed protein product [Pseudo-nitzschia multistriata]|uniref:ABC transporter domain-containing protein n=1 Tax=Pseudo-nitzschia multistriata TaxID=183589 RepID=A0A448ZCG8_9STRA|nr:unnamed protein product [Pseudo-nitzschia multistriata]
MWEIDSVYRDPSILRDGRREKESRDAALSFVVSAHASIASCLGNKPSFLPSFHEGGNGSRVALADFASRCFLRCKQKNGTAATIIVNENVDVECGPNEHVSFHMETLDEALLNRRQRKNTRSRVYHPYVVERSDFFCRDDKLQVTTRLKFSQKTNDELSEEHAKAIVLKSAQSIFHRVFPIDDPAFGQSLLQHVACVVLQQRLRCHLSSIDAIAFICDGSILPRKSGTSAAPMESPPAVPFKAPADSRMTTSISINMGSLREHLPSSLMQRGNESMSTVVLSGLLVTKGVTLICGGGYHGKSTLLQAISVGHFDKIPGDGREMCVSISDAVSIRAEDGRYVNNCNISAFISNLPTPPGVKATIDTEHFSTRDSSGSTSQAANVAEAIEFGAKALLVDEDISAANFMARDGRMRALVMDESITPLLYRVNGLYNAHGISSVVVVGGVGDWLDVPNNVVLLDKYVVFDATAKAQSISRQFSYGHVEYAGRGVVHRLQWEKKGTPKLRRPADAFSKRFDSDVVVSLLDGGYALALYKEHDEESSIDDDDEAGCIDASRLEQLLGKRQLFATGLCVAWILQNSPMHPNLGVRELLKMLDSKLEKEGINQVVQELKERDLSLISKSMVQVLESVGFLERPRSFEIGQALARVHGIQFEDMPMEDDPAEEAARLEQEKKKKALAEMWAKRRSK